MKTALVSLNVSYIHKNLALRWLYVSRPMTQEVKIFEGVTKHPLGILQALIDYQAEAIGFSCFVFNVEATLKLILAIKHVSPQTRIYVGGPEATYHPDVFWNVGVDGILRGEAEFSFWKAIEGIETEGLQRSPKDQAVVLKTDLRLLEALESPYFLDFDQKDMNTRYLYVETSRGCPYGCTYCMASLDLQVRQFSMDHMNRFFNELKYFAVRQVKFLDRSFNVQADRALAIAQACLDVPQPTNFHVELVGDTLDDRLIHFFTHEGQTRFRMEVGVQSFNEKTLQAVGRVSHLDALISTISRFSEAQCHQHTDLIAGLPYEDLDAFKQSLQILAHLKPMEIQVGILKLLHGTSLYTQRDAYGYVHQPYAPYQIISNHWMTTEAISKVEACALGMEKCYNSGRLRDALQSLFEGLEFPIFECLAAIGLELQSLAHPYDQHRFYLAVYQGLKDYTPHAQSMVEQAYYQASKIKPKRLFEKAEIEALKSIILSFNERDSSLQSLNGIYLKDEEGIHAWFYKHHLHVVYHLTLEGTYLSHETYPSHP